MPKLDQSTFDRAVAVVLELAEDNEQSADTRYSAAFAIVSSNPGAYEFPEPVSEPE